MNGTSPPILGKIADLLKEQKKTQKELCAHLGLKQQAFTNWKSGDNDSYMKYLPQIAEFFGVSVDYLLGTPSTSERSLLPADLLELLSTLSDKELDEVRNYTRFIISKRSAVCPLKE